MNEWLDVGLSWLRWEKMRQESKKRQRADRRLNLFWRKNKCFTTQFGEMTKPPVPKKRDILNNLKVK